MLFRMIRDWALLIEQIAINVTDATQKRALEC